MAFTPKQKKIRIITTSLLAIVVLMIVIEQIFDFSKYPLWYLYYYGLVSCLVIMIFCLTLWDFYQIRKKLRNSLGDDKEFIKDIVQKAIERK